MRSLTAAVYAVLYLPIVTILIFSLNSAPNVSAFEGFSLVWYAKAFSNRLVQEAALNSLIVASATAVLSALIGTAATIGLMGTSRRTRTLITTALLIGLTIPGIVIGLASLVFFSSTFGLLNNLASQLGSTQPRTFGVGLSTVIAAHTLFCTALVVEIGQIRLRQMDPALIQASYDLYATEGETLRRVVLPYLGPAILAGFLISFVFSFDEFVIAFFVSGPNTTLPVYLFASVRRGITPELNAIVSMVLIASVALSAATFLVLRRSGPR